MPISAPPYGSIEDNLHVDLFVGCEIERDGLSKTSLASGIPNPILRVTY